MSSVTTFEKVEQELLNLIQSEFPLREEPYRAIADRLAINEEDVLDLLIDLKRRNIVRQISAIFDTRKLGYKTSLVAMKFLDDELDQAAQSINKHPGVSHNYGRTGYFNLWFTVAVAPGVSLDETVELLAAETNAMAWRMLPTKRFFKIGVNFDMVNKRSNARENYANIGAAPAVETGVDEDWNRPQELSGRDIEVIRELQEDLPLIPRPFDAMATRLRASVQELFSFAEDMVERKVMRRFGAVLHHRRAGFSANAMVVWNVPPERSQEVGDLMASSAHVTHCYERPTYDDWKYSHYTMIHATTERECEQIAGEIAEQIGIDDRQLVYSTREYKKTRVRYFV